MGIFDLIKKLRKIRTEKIGDNKINSDTKKDCIWKMDDELYPYEIDNGFCEYEINREIWLRDERTIHGETTIYGELALKRISMMNYLDTNFAAPLQGDQIQLAKKIAFKTNFSWILDRNHVCQIYLDDFIKNKMTNLNLINYIEEKNYLEFLLIGKNDTAQEEFQFFLRKYKIEYDDVLTAFFLPSKIFQERFFEKNLAKNVDIQGYFVFLNEKNEIVCFFKEHFLYDADPYVPHYCIVKFDQIKALHFLRTENVCIGVNFYVKKDLYLKRFYELCN